MPTAIVTGGSMGLGQALARGLAAGGWDVVIDARNAENLGRAAEALKRATGSAAKVVALPGDITDASHRAKLVAAAEQLGGLELVVNNASTLGSTPLPPLIRYPLDALRLAHETNVVAPLALVQLASHLLAQAPRPRIVNITSDASVEAYPGWGGYGATKAALDHVSAVLAVEEAPWKVWAVDPGDLRTAMHQDAFPGEDISDRPEPESVVPALLALIDSDRPSGRVRLSELAPAGSEP